MTDEEHDARSDLLNYIQTKLDDYQWATVKAFHDQVCVGEIFMIEICVGEFINVFVGSKKLGTWVDWFGRFIGQIQNALFRWKNFKDEI